MTTETKTTLAFCVTTFACLCACLATIFLVAAMTFKRPDADPLPLYRIQALPAPPGYPGPVPTPEPIAPPRPSSEREKES